MKESTAERVKVLGVKMAALCAGKPHVDVLLAALSIVEFCADQIDAKPGFVPEEMREEVLPVLEALKSVWPPFDRR